MSHQDDPQQPQGIQAEGEGEPTSRAPAEAVHPTDDVLAAFVDGTASPEERRLVERHLPACAACTTDVAAARNAHAALRSLPEVDSPWTDSGVEPLVAAATEPPPAIRIRERRGARIGWRGTAAAALAAAAVLTGVVVLLGHGSSNNSPALSAAAPPRAAAGTQAVTQQSLYDLTRSLAAAGAGTPAERAHQGASATAAATGGGAFGSEGSSPTPTLLAPDAVGGIPCARRASAQPVSAVAIYARTATFNGKPVWVIGFVSAASGGQVAHVEVVAVTTNNCSVAFLARQPLAS